MTLSRSRLRTLDTSMQSTELSLFVRIATTCNPVGPLTGLATWQWLDGTALPGRPLLAVCGGILVAAIVWIACDALIITIAKRLRKRAIDPAGPTDTAGV